MLPLRSRAIFGFSLAVLAYGPTAGAVGFLRMDSEGFLLDSANRPNSSSVLAVGPDLEGQGRFVEGRLEAEAIGFLQDPSSFTFEATNAYVATSSRLSPHHQISLGRRLFSWSMADDVWKMGLWTPRFNWDPLRPEQIGLTGLFYTYESALWKIKAYGSGISIPERGYTIRNDLTSASPDAPPLYNQMMLGSQVIPISYNVSYPSAADLLVRPSAALSLRYGADTGPWASGTVGIMPLNQPILAVDPQINSTGTALDITVHPSVISHRLATAEAGYSEKEWSLWGSVSGESPDLVSQPSNWLTNPIGPSAIAALGGTYRWSKSMTLAGSFLSIYEDTSIETAALAAAQAQAGGVPLNLPPRYNYTRALRATSQWVPSEQWHYDFSWTYDIPFDSHWVSADVTYAPLRQSWYLGFGTDVFASSTGQGQIGQYVGDDRLRARIAYVF